MQFGQLADITGGKLCNANQTAITFSGVSIDSRTLTKGELFVAIEGEKYDGHDFVTGALENGAAGVLADAAFDPTQTIPSDVPVVSVTNTHRAMLKLASDYRNRCGARFVGITGSNGKTSTKELCYHLVRAVDKDVYRSPGNFNNLFGTPLAIFNVPDEAKVVFLEIGISTPDEMPQLAELVHPDVIAITNVGPSHLEFFGTVENVARAKLELARRASGDVPLIVNADDPVLMQQASALGRDLVTFGIDNHATFTPTSVELMPDGGSIVVIDGHEFRLSLVGRHHVYNLLAAYAIAVTLGYKFAGVNTERIVLETAPMRGQLITRNGIQFYCDCYNANPDSMKAGLTAFFKIQTEGRTILVLGDMLELGVAGPQLHGEIGRYLASYEFDMAFFVGEMSGEMAAQALAMGVSEDKIWYTNVLKGRGEDIAGKLQKGDLVMVKASRGIGLDRLIDLFDEEGAS